MVTIGDNYRYYGSVRSEITSLLPEKADRVLDVGCGAGKTLAWIRNLKQSVWTAGVELDPGAAAEARNELDAVYETSIEDLSLPLQENSLDLILCLDVFEHLHDPWQVAKYLARLLKPGGSLIASIPNVRNRHVLLPLLLRGRWSYVDSGILDITHLRFFTRKSTVELVESAGLAVDRTAITGGISRGKSGRMLTMLLPTGLLEFFARQYLVRGIKAGSSRVT